MKAGTLPRLDYDTILCDVLNGDDIEFWREHSEDIVHTVRRAMALTGWHDMQRWEYVSEAIVELAQEWAHLHAAQPETLEVDV
jgi:hypothetical protein